MGVKKSPQTSWTVQECSPQIASSAYISETAAVIGPVQIGEDVLVSPGAGIRGDEGGRIYIGNRANVQDNVIIHGLKRKKVLVGKEEFSVYISEGVSCAHACIIHGPAFIGSNTFVGFGAIIHCANVGNRCFIGHGARVIGVNIPDGKFIPHGICIDTQEAADSLLDVISHDSSLHHFNYEVVEVNVELAKGYKKQVT